MRAPTASIKEFGLLLLLGLLWGAPYALTKISLETIPPITLTAARVSIAAVMLWIITAIYRREIPRRLNFVGRVIVQSCIACVVPYTFIAFGQRSVDSGLAAVLNSSTPIFVCIIGLAWTHHEPITTRRMFGAIIGLSGVVLIVGANSLMGLGHPSAGQIAIVLATISSAFSVIYGRHFTGVAPEVVAAAVLTSAAIMLVPACMLVETPWHVVPSLPSVTALGVNAVGATAVGFVIYFRLIRTIGSTATASTGYLKPAVGVLIGCLFLGEGMNLTTGLGLFAILLGVTAINSKVSLLASRVIPQSGGLEIPGSRLADDGSRLQA